MINQNTTERSTLGRIWIHGLESFFSAFSLNPDKSKSYRFKKYFSATDLSKIESAVAKSETLHNGEIKVVLEGGLPVFRVISGLTAKQRATELFSEKKYGTRKRTRGF